MIKKIALTTALFLLAYNLLLSLNPNVEAAQHHWQENEIRPQKYIYRDASFTNVIVGTSLCFSLPMDSLEGFFNLSLIGRTPFDGLAFVCHSSMKMPKRIFIETNFYMKQEDTPYVQSFYWPLSFYYRKYFWSSRAGKQPVPLAISTAAKLLRGKRRPGQQENGNIDKKVTADLAEANSGFFSYAPESFKFSDQLKELSYYVQMLERNNVQVVFFEMPMDKRFANSALATTARNLLVKTFPKDQYHYIDQPDCSDYSTTDGIHLSYASILKYIAYFKTAIAENDKAFR